ncbi:MAG: ABC transporter permease, partial [Alphaproteobacteria bacterium]|nr:ABC transporter permease [Alphaproteobacteria bacterium]
MNRSLFSLIRVALSDLRGGLRSFWILIACIALGVATVAMVGSVGASLQSALARDARLLLGGDIEFRLTHRPADPAERALFAELGEVSEVIDFIGRAQTEGISVLAMVRAVDAAYPLRGVVAAQGDGTLAEQLQLRDGARGVLVDQRLLDRLGLGIGSSIRLGKAELQIRGILNGVPDQVSQGVAIGFPLLMSTDALAETNILQPGSLARYRYKIALADGTDAASAARLVQERFADAGWRISLPGDATEEMSRYFDLLRRFLTVVGLSALLMGGLGVAHAVSAYVTERQRSIATMKALGATRGRVMLHFLTQIIVLTMIGIVLGLAVGVGFTMAVLPLLGPTVGLPLTPTIDARSILSSTAFGLLTGFLFAYLPLNRAEALRPAQLFRSAASVTGGSGRLQHLLRPRTLLPMLGAMAGLFAVAVVDTGRVEIVFWYGVGALLAFLVLRVAAHLLQRGLRLLPPAPHAVLRNAIKSIHRAGSPAPAVILSLGLGVALLLLIALVENNLRHQLDPAVRVDAPDFLYMDLFEDEVAAFQAVAATDNRIADFTSVPLVRASSFTINGKAPPELKEPPKDLTLYFGDEQPLTYAADIPSGSRIVSGKWWPADHAGPALVSVTDDLRKPLGLKLGDEITFVIFGQPIAATVASFRSYEWQRGGINFPYVLSPG